MNYGNNSTLKATSPGKVLTGVVASAVVLSAMAGLTAMMKKPVFADGAYTLTFSASQGHTLEEIDGHLKIDGDDFVDLRSGENTIGTVACVDTSNCTITVSDGTSGELNYNGQNGNFTLFVGGQKYSFGTQFNTNTQIAVEDYQDDSQQQFNGHAWFVWNCGGNFCKHKFENLTPAGQTQSGTLLYETNYIKASEVTDGSNSVNIAELIKSGQYYWLHENSGDAAAAANLTTWASFESYMNNIVKDDYDAMQAFAIDPTGASDGNNIISTNGNRDFRATIYNDGSYFGISNASSIDNLTYYPDFWDEAFFNPAYDISGTTAENPAVIKTVLYEPTITLRSDEISAPISKIEIADKTPANAVDITSSDHIFTIRFKSNFYDKTVFKVTNTAGKSYYIMLARITVDERGGLYVPTSDTNEYSIYAKWTLANGSVVNTTLERNTEADRDGGKGLKFVGYRLSKADSEKVVFKENATNSPIAVVFTVVKSGSDASSYKGTLAGSGKGTGYKVENRRWVFNTGLGE